MWTWHSCLEPAQLVRSRAAEGEKDASLRELLPAATALAATTPPSHVWAIQLSLVRELSGAS